MRLSIANLDREPSMMDRIFEMMERHCPRLMKSGGGHLSQDFPDRHAHSLGCKTRMTTPEQDARILALAREGKLSAKQISIEVGTTASVVRGRLTRAGIVVPDGRLMR
jgi:hypothetical protein